MDGEIRRNSALSAPSSGPRLAILTRDLLIPVLLFLIVLTLVLSVILILYHLD